MDNYQNEQNPMTRVPDHLKAEDGTIDISQRRRLLSLATIIVLLIVVIIAIMISRLGLMPLDLPATQALQSLQTAWLTAWMVIVSIPGWYPWNIIIVGIGSIVAGWYWSLRIGVYVFIIASLQALFNWLIKNIVARPRPSEPLVDVIKLETGYSFPSGHVMFYTIFFGLLVFLILRYVPRTAGRAIVLLMLGGMILLVGISRMYLGAHWLSDVIAGYLVGLVCLGWVIEVFIGHVESPRAN